eukprot:SAG11_NODE_1306_length_5245_cov_6.023513_5_plen_70_part_00
MRIEPSGPLLMSGGRLCVENTTGIFLWVNRDAMASLDIRDGGDGNECTHRRLCQLDEFLIGSLTISVRC